MGDSVKKFHENENNPHWETNNTINSQTIYPGDINITENIQTVKSKFEQRSQLGIKKYNTTLERDDLNLQDWLNHLQEELMDATLYIERLKAELKQ